MALLAAIVTGMATIAAAVIAFVGNERRRATLELLAKADDRRLLSVAELDAINIQKSAAEQLGAVPPANASTGTAQIRMIFHGSSAFAGYSRDSRQGQRYETRYVSPISVDMDGQSIGSGDGERGFQLNFEASVGRHTTVFSWSGNESCTDDRFKYTGNYDRDIKGRTELTFWIVRGGSCVIHLDSGFGIDHVEPPIVLPICYTCRMPGIKKCKCGRRYCSEHTSVWSEQEVCLACKEAGVQNQLEIAKVLAIVVAVLGAIAAIYFWFSR